MKRRSRWDQQAKASPDADTFDADDIKSAKKQRLGASKVLRGILGLGSLSPNESGLARRPVKLDLDEQKCAYIVSKAFKLRLLDELQLASNEVFAFQLDMGSKVITLSASSEELANLAEHLFPTILSKTLPKAVDSFTRRIDIGFEPSNEMLPLVRRKILGPHGTFLKHIQAEAPCRVQLRGLGSGSADCPAGPLHLQVQAAKAESLQTAQLLCNDLLATVKTECDTKPFLAASYPPPYPSHYYYSYPPHQQ